MLKCNLLCHTCVFFCIQPGTGFVCLCIHLGIYVLHMESESVAHL